MAPKKPVKVKAKKTKARAKATKKAAPRLQSTRYVDAASPRMVTEG